MLDSSQLETYELLDLQKSIIPQRSTLYPLAPIAIGTPDVESLTSYISRLSEAHCVASGDLCFSEILPLLEENLDFPERHKGISIIFQSVTNIRAVNGIGSIARRTVQALEKLTLLDRLDSLTLLNWSNSFSSRGLLRIRKAWCLACFQSLLAQDKLIYEPLLWVFNTINVCPYHQIALQDKCPHCLHQVYPLEWKSRTGFCSKCQKWLGFEAEDLLQTPAAATATSKLISNSDALQFESWKANSIGTLLSSTSYPMLTEQKSKVKTSIRICIDLLEGRAPLTRLLNVSSSGLRRWYTGENIPTLDTLLKICFLLKIPFLDFLTGELIGVNLSEFITAHKAEIQHRRQQANTHCQKPFDKAKIHRILLDALSEEPVPQVNTVADRLGYKTSTMLRRHFPELCKNIATRHREYSIKKRQEELRQKVLEAVKKNRYSPQSLRAVANEINESVSTLYKQFPQECREITTKFKQHRQVCKAKRFRKLRQKVRKVAIRLHSEGIQPTDRNVSINLDKPGFLKEPRVVDFLREIQKELGFIK